MRRCLAETGSAIERSEREEKIVFGNFEAAIGEAECAATQTVHVAASSEPE
jgi:hypothetical protein